VSIGSLGAGGTDENRRSPGVRIVQLPSEHPAAIPPEYRGEFLRASREAIPSIVADYRACAGIDARHDRDDRALGRGTANAGVRHPKDWGAIMGYDAAALWRTWARDLDHRTLSTGHFIAEEAPAEVISAIRQLLTG
jgi:haloacetate dehalogenase